MIAGTKLNSVRRYLLEKGDSKTPWEAVQLLSDLIYKADSEQRARNAYRRAARKFGKEAIEYVTGFYNLPGAGPDGMDHVHAGRAAKKAASNAFAAHPEWRE